MLFVLTAFSVCHNHVACCSGCPCHILTKLYNDWVDLWFWLSRGEVGALWEVKVGIRHPTGLTHTCSWFPSNRAGWLVLHNVLSEMFWECFQKGCFFFFFHHVCCPLIFKFLAFLCFLLNIDGRRDNSFFVIKTIKNHFWQIKFVSLKYSISF